MKLYIDELKRFDLYIPFILAASMIMKLIHECIIAFLANDSKVRDVGCIKKTGGSLAIAKEPPVFYLIILCNLTMDSLVCSFYIEFPLLNGIPNLSHNHRNYNRE